jgi:uncharacterized protein
MPAETNLQKLLQTMQPCLNEGQYVFCTTDNTKNINDGDILFLFKETEGITVVVKKEVADALKLSYDFIAAWITLNVYSSLKAVGLTAAFSTALANEGISCNVVAAYYHDHIFVDENDAIKAMEVLANLSKI